MNTKQEFERIMETQTEIALSTSVANQPNVRIVNFYYDVTSHVLYFTTFGDNDKVKEFGTNSKIAFTTIPHANIEHVKATGTVLKSEKTVMNIADHFISKIPSYQETIDCAGEFLVVYEIHFDKAIVTLDFEQIETLSFSA